MSLRAGSFDEWKRSFVVRRLGILASIALLALATYTVGDAVSFGWGSDIVRYRIVSALAVAGLLVIRNTSFVRRYIDLALIVSVCALSFSTMLVVEAQAVRGIGSQEAAFFSGLQGLSLIILGFAVTIPARWPTHATIQAASLGFFYFNSPELFSAAATEGQLIWSLTNIFWVCVICDISIILYENLQRSEFETRGHLARSNLNLETANAQLEQVSHARKTYLDALVGIGISATSTDPTEQARAVLDEMMRLLRADRAYLYLLDSGGRLRFQAGRRSEGGDAVRPEKSEAAWLNALAGVPGTVAVGRFALGEQAIHDRPDGAGDVLLSVPLGMREQAIGAIFLEKRDSAGASASVDDDFIQALASHVAIALETVRTTEELRQAHEEALAAGRTKDAFLKTMSHELRTPLNAVIGYSEMLMEDLDEKGDADRLADVRRIHEASTQLMNGITDILELTKMETERLTFEIGAFDPGELAREIQTELEPLAKARQNEFELIVKEEVGLMKSDRKKVEFILRKLLDNACKFTHGGRISCEIGRLERGGERFVSFSVIDSGIGMTEEQLDRIFEPFYQADPSATRRYGGMGLGLTAALRLCEKLGGSISARSSKGQGSTFTVTLPASPDDASAVR